jgi:hypothetical protein
MHPMVLLGDEAQLEACFGPFRDSANLFFLRIEIVLILTQVWCTVCAECTIGSKIVFDVSDGTPR